MFRIQRRYLEKLCTGTALPAAPGGDGDILDLVLGDDGYPSRASHHRSGSSLNRDLSLGASLSCGAKPNVRGCRTLLASHRRYMGDSAAAALSRGPQHMKLAQDSAARLWIMPAAIWLALLLLLAITIGAAYLPLGPGNGVVSMGIAACKAALILLFFMELKTSSALLRLASLAGVFWLVLMFSPTFGDYLSRQAPFSYIGIG